LHEKYLQIHFKSQSLQKALHLLWSMVPSVFLRCEEGGFVISSIIFAPMQLGFLNFPFLVI
jgi:hypothetical protein